MDKSLARNMGMVIYYVKGRNC